MRFLRVLLDFFTRKGVLKPFHLRIGEEGERRAKAFLKRKGYAIVTRNWKSGNKEIDIVARDGKTLVFVEVKTRKADALQRGFYAVGEQKKRHLEVACKAYLRALKYPPKTFRFDIIEVQYTDSQQYSVHHYENVLLFPKYFHCE